MKILQRYILKELLPPFAGSLAIFTFVMVVGNLIKLAELVINKGVPITAILQLFLCLIPYLLSYTIPMALLTGVLLAFGRLSADNEITAMKAAGINLYSLFAPLLVTGLLLSLGNMFLNDRILPEAHFKSRSILKDIGMKQPTAYLESGTFIKSFKNYIIFIHRIEGKLLKQIRIYQPRENKTTRTIVAKEGEFITIPEKGILKLKLLNGISDEPDVDNPDKFYKLDFKKYYITLNLKDMFQEGRIDKKPKDMTIAELKQELKNITLSDIDIAPLATEIHRKISIAFAPIVFILLGFPMAITVRRNEKMIGFAVSLGVILIYYLLSAGGTALSLKGDIPPLIGMWAPNFIFTIAGVLLLHRAAEK